MWKRRLRRRPDQSRDQPRGRGAEQLHQWFLSTRTFQRNVLSQEGGTTGDFAARSFENLGAWILGRNMSGPVRGPWPDLDWKGWWGTNPPYYVPVFVLTHHARPPLEVEGGTVFHFITEGIEAALDQARAAAGGKDVRVGGGAAIVYECGGNAGTDEVAVGYNRGDGVAREEQAFRRVVSSRTPVHGVGGAGGRHRRLPVGGAA